jgi:hypothetical protein
MLSIVSYDVAQCELDMETYDRGGRLVNNYRAKVAGHVFARFWPPSLQYSVLSALPAFEHPIPETYPLQDKAWSALD